MPADSRALHQARAAAQLWVSEVQVTRYGDGHIHDTFLVQGQTPAAERQITRLVLQRLNEHVFVDLDLVRSQTERVLACWSQQQDYLCPTLQPTLQPTKTGDCYVRTSSGVWRAWRLISGRTVDPPTSAEQAHAAGLAFSRFQCAMTALSEPRLQSTIAGFLDLQHYLQEYDRVAAHTPDNLRQLIDEHRHLVTALGPAGSHIHGDCKVDNLLFDAQRDAVIAVLDFDTVMYGHRALDFGDLVRSISASRGRFEVPMYRHALGGFIEGGVALSAPEALAAPSYVTYMLGLRFLTDHLSGDVYFKTSFTGENLERAVAQFRLLAALDEHRAEMAAVVGELH